MTKTSYTPIPICYSTEQRQEVPNSELGHHLQSRPALTTQNHSTFPYHESAGIHRSSTTQGANKYESYADALILGRPQRRSASTFIRYGWPQNGIWNRRQYSKQTYPRPSIVGLCFRCGDRDHFKNLCRNLIKYFCCKRFGHTSRTCKDVTNRLLTQSS